MPMIELSHVTKRWGSYYGVDDLSMVIDDNSFVTLLGPSGCGKTTTLRMIAGLETPTSGRITIGDQVVFDSSAGIDVPPNKRRVGFLFQNYALWPNMTIYKNIAFGLANVHEELPVVDDDAVHASGMIRALQDPEEVMRLTAAARTGKGRLDEARTLNALINAFEISTSSAKEILSVARRASDAGDSRFADMRKQYETRLETIRSRYDSAGTSLDERFRVLDSDGRAQRAVRKLSSQQIDLRVREVARTVRIGPFMDRYPSELSGGQQQRVAIARTLAPEPKVLFMDEPLSNLDAKLRLEMRSELQRLHIETGSTFVYVTHDQGEAMTLATRICLLDNAVLQQYDAPLEVYSKPTNLFTADFVGNPPINLLAATNMSQTGNELSVTILGDHNIVFTPGEPLDISTWLTEQETLDANAEREAAALRAAEGHPEKENTSSSFQFSPSMTGEADDLPVDHDDQSAELLLGVRPEFVVIRDGGAFEGQVYSSMPTGLETTVRLQVGQFLLTSVLFGGATFTIGDTVRFDILDDHATLFSMRNGKRITGGRIRRV